MRQEMAAAGTVICRELISDPWSCCQAPLKASRLGVSGKARKNDGALVPPESAVAMMTYTGTSMNAVARQQTARIAQPPQVVGRESLRADVAFRGGGPKPAPSFERSARDTPIADLEVYLAVWTLMARPF